MYQLVAEALLLVAISFVLYTALFFVFSLFEIMFPAERGHSLRGRIRNLGFTAIFLSAGTFVTLWLDSWLHYGTREIMGASWLENVFWVLLFIFVFDFFYYWYHRAQHTWAFLWPIHELHHADTELNVTSSYRTYWLEMPLQSLLVSFPASLVVGSFSDLFVVSFMTFLLWEFFTHANIRLHLYWLSPVVCGPQVHRIHHSCEVRHRNRNFAQYFPVFDVMFGTYYAPAKDEFPPTGNSGLAVDAPIRVTLVRPLRQWQKMLFKRWRRGGGE